jgi:hypothetical protein
MSEVSNEKGFQPDEQVETLYKDEDPDEMKNEQAFKGDDSDGKVNWTFRNVVAAIALGGLYTGKYSHRIDMRRVNLCRIPNYAILRWRLSVLYH